MLDESIGKGRLAMIDMGDDREITDVVHAASQASPESMSGEVYTFCGRYGRDAPSTMRRIASLSSAYWQTGFPRYSTTGTRVP